MSQYTRLFNKVQSYCEKKFHCRIEINMERFKNSHPESNASLIETSLLNPLIVCKEPESINVIWSILHEIGHLFVRKYTYIDYFTRNIAVQSLNGFRVASKKEKIIHAFNLLLDETLAWVFAYFLTYKFRVKRRGFSRFSIFCLSTYWNFATESISYESRRKRI